jgi:hypothetical protein
LQQDDRERERVHRRLYLERHVLQVRHEDPQRQVLPVRLVLVADAEVDARDEPRVQ